MDEINYEAVSGWIGLETHDGYIIDKFIGIGDEHVVYQASKDMQSFAVKFPRNHIGFTINFPPDKIFRTGNSIVFKSVSFQLMTEESNIYHSRINKLLLEMINSEALFHLYPLSAIWKIVAIEMIGKYPEKGIISIKDMIQSIHIINKLREIAQYDEDDDSQIVVIGLGEHDILECESKSILSAKAEEKLKNIDIDLYENGELCIDNNPFVPFICALCSGYSLSDDSYSTIAKIIDKIQDGEKIFRSLGNLLYILNKRLKCLDNEKRIEISDLVKGVFMQSEKLNINHLEMVFRLMIGKKE